MLPPEEYMSLESAIASLRRDSPEELKAIAMAINSVDPNIRFTRSTIDGSEYGKTVQGFAITYGQLGAYLNLAVDKYASVLIETEVGVLHSQHVKVNREWLLAQREQVTQLPEVAKTLAFKSFRAHGAATVTPIFSPLTDQNPDAARAELRKLKIRIEKILALPADDIRDQEIERLQILVHTSYAEKMAAIEAGVALARTVKTLTLENDQLRKARIEKPAPTNPLLYEPNPAKRPLSNVEIRNAAIQKARETVCEVARGLWAHPDLAECRTGKMAQIVRRSVDQELLKLLPKTDIALGRWLTADAAPPSAKRKGRPSKSDPNK
jgi:hypothetical protein